MNSNFVIVYSFLYPHEMEIAKHALESHGITCYAEDNLTIQSYQFISNAVGGVKLLVAREDFKQASEFLILKEFIPKPTNSDKESPEVILNKKLLKANTLLKRIPFKLLFVICLVIMIYYFNT